MASTKVKKSNLDSSVFTDLSITGNVSATGNFYDANGLVGGTDTELRALTGNWQDTSTTVQGNSAQWASNIDTGVRALTGDFFTNDGGNIYGNVIVFGTLSATSGITNVSTASTSTSTLSVLNTDPTSPGPALVVEQAGPFDIAVFRDSEGGDIVHINNITPLDGAPGAVGIRTNNPNETLTVRGTLSASGAMFSNGLTINGSVSASGPIYSQNGTIKPLSGIGGISVNNSLTNVTIISATGTTVIGNLLAAYVGNTIFV